MSFGNRFKDWVNHRVDCEWEQAGEAELLRKSSIYIYMSIEEPNSNIVQKTSTWKSNQVYKHMYVMFCINKDGKKTDLRIYIVFPGQYI